jgi:hypothetical protein
VRVSPDCAGDPRGEILPCKGQRSGRDWCGTGPGRLCGGPLCGAHQRNNPVYLEPQYDGTTIVSGRTYAALCDAVVAGVKSTLIRGELVACGATAPRGNNDPNSARPSVSPLAFLRAMKQGGARGFDAYAHHPYHGSPGETPTTPPPTGNAVTLANIGSLEKEVSRLYGPLPIWITEYGYQTNPPDDIFGVSDAQQAAYMRQAYAIARKDPRIDMLVWFLLKDDADVSGWQSGLMTVSGARKPAWSTFRATPAARRVIAGQKRTCIACRGTREERAGG